MPTPITVKDVADFLRDSRECLTLNAIARAVKEALTPEEVNLLIENLEAVRV
jgi:hypothetical protein